MTFTRLALANVGRELTDSLWMQIKTLQELLLDAEAFDVLSTEGFRNCVQSLFSGIECKAPFTTLRAAIVGVVALDAETVINQLRLRRFDEDPNFDEATPRRRRGCECMSKKQRRAHGAMRRQRAAGHSWQVAEPVAA